MQSKRLRPSQNRPVKSQLQLARDVALGASTDDHPCRLLMTAARRLLRTFCWSRYFVIARRIGKRGEPGLNKSVYLYCSKLYICDRRSISVRVYASVFLCSFHFLNIRIGGKKYPGWKTVRQTQAIAIIIPSRSRNSFSFLISSLPQPRSSFERPAISGIR